MCTKVNFLKKFWIFEKFQKKFEREEISLKNFKKIPES